MSALAQILSAQGARVSGCDVKKCPKVNQLIRAGILFFEGHDPRHIKDTDLFVYTSAIADSPELAAARRKKIITCRRGNLLAQLINRQFGVAVCGAHGKTTTTALIATLLRGAGQDPTFLIGGEVENLGGNAHAGNGKIWVTEADESDGSFLELMPRIGVVTNIDREHLDFYRNDWAIEDAYQRFMAQTAAQGVVVVCVEDPWIQKISRKIKGRWIGYGMSPTAQLQARNIQYFSLASEFDLFWENRFSIHARINAPGEHNVLNALAAFAVGIQTGLPVADMARAILSFQGVSRRFQIKNRAGDIWVIDDYAHHPTEIAATLGSVRCLGRGRTIGVFQPHRYTRTAALITEFTKVLQQVDQLILTEIYAASEKPISNVSGRQLYQKVVEYGHSSCEYIEKKEDITARLLGLARPGDTLLFLGAGNITEVADEVAEKLRNENSE
ncbi:MAG: UDP-N-acetylmuramate--L-alanine ligase, partial [Candidatus Omnitrophica bacterium]|nr:UDP-N-acetylmuramate--L-alanine ligase [Candidatus Omnitrophota bacterium]